MPKAPKVAQKESNAWLPWLADVTVLSDVEADSIRQNLLIGLQQIEQALDEMITVTNKHKAQAVIWSDIDDEDNAFLAEAWLRVARRHVAAAWAVRGIANSAVLLRAGMITVPRFVRSFRFYAQHGGLGWPV